MTTITITQIHNLYFLAIITTKIRDSLTIINLKYLEVSQGIIIANGIATTIIIITTITILVDWINQ